MDLKEAKELAISYGIVFPLTFDDFLKQRASIFIKNHPDKGAKITTEEFEIITTVLATVKDNFDIINGFISSGLISSSMTKTGELLSSLGKGLGNLTNGTKCNICKGDGYTIQKTPIFGIKKDFCDCDNGYIHSDKCKYCKGTGVYLTKSGFEVKCKACDGSGIHVYQHPRQCPKCRYTRLSIFDYLFGYETIIDYKDEYHKCYHCNGTGEIEILNPVFQKGAMSIGNVQKGKVVVEDHNLKLKRFNKIMNRR